MSNEETKQLERAAWVLYNAACHELDKNPNAQGSTLDALINHINDIHDTWWLLWRQSLMGV